MKKKILAVFAAVAVIAAGVMVYGSTRPDTAQGATAAETAKAMMTGDWNKDGDKASEVQCVKRSERTFRCMGKFDYKDPEYTDEENASWEVTVDKDGWLAEPLP